MAHQIKFLYKQVLTILFFTCVAGVSAFGQCWWNKIQVHANRCVDGSIDFYYTQLVPESRILQVYFSDLVNARDPDFIGTVRDRQGFLFRLLPLSEKRDIHYKYETLDIRGSLNMPLNKDYMYAFPFAKKGSYLIESDDVRQDLRNESSLIMEGQYTRITSANDREVLAMRPGYVVEIRKVVNDGGQGEGALIVAHDDGSFLKYEGLELHSLPLEMGDFVKRRSRIATLASDGILELTLATFDTIADPWSNAVCTDCCGGWRHYQTTVIYSHQYGFDLFVDGDVLPLRPGLVETVELFDTSFDLEEYEEELERFTLDSPVVLEHVDRLADMIGHSLLWRYSQYRELLRNELGSDEFVDNFLTLVAASILSGGDFDGVEKSLEKADFIDRSGKVLWNKEKEEIVLDLLPLIQLNISGYLDIQPNGIKFTPQFIDRLHSVMSKRQATCFFNGFSASGFSLFASLLLPNAQLFVDHQSLNVLKRSFRHCKVKEDLLYMENMFEAWVIDDDPGVPPFRFDLIVLDATLHNMEKGMSFIHKIAERMDEDSECYISEPLYECWVHERTCKNLLRDETLKSDLMSQGLVVVDNQSYQDRSKIVLKCISRE